jgi:hypothetical protein
MPSKRPRSLSAARRRHLATPRHPFVRDLLAGTLPLDTFRDTTLLDWHYELAVNVNPKSGIERRHVRRALRRLEHILDTRHAAHGATQGEGPSAVALPTDEGDNVPLEKRDPSSLGF